ncbi:hypothetical protein SAMN04487950_4319 [Halogranum rubrum]|uniref:Uncharacterized protein n=1 Tax=Halogranum rubrum TaxID=553466 RepID=A0A1I4IZX8_9EURY|nr:MULTISPECIES: hypothetical protein [Halogranum]SFL59958.1 hypothetical protein SAMN04487950_4319 [Halogranum rubrum]
MSSIDPTRTPGAVSPTRRAPSSGTLTRTTSFCTGTAVRTSKAPPSVTKLGTLLVLLVLFTAVLAAIELTGAQ